MARALEQSDHEVWWDRRLDGGEEFSAEIEAALEKSDVVVVAWSKDSIRSRWVRDEAAVGGDSGRLLPVSIDGSLPPMGFRQFHTLDLTNWRGGKRDHRTAELLHSVERRLRAKGKDAGLATPRPISQPTHRSVFPTGKVLWSLVTTIAIVLAVAGLLIFQNFRRPENAPLKPTIALLPFTTVTADPELRTLGSQTRGSIAHTFAQSGLPLQLLDAVSKEERRPADFLISGEVSRNGDKFLTTVRLDEAAHGVTVYSHRFEATGEDARDLPDRIGAQLAGNLTWSFPLMVLDRRRPLDPALIADLLRGDFTTGDTLQVYQTSKRVAAKAPNVQPTQTSVAFNTAFALSQLPRDERAGAVAEARRAAARGIALGPEYGDAHATWCILHSETLWGQCENRLRVGRQADPDAPFLNTFLSHLLRNVGRFDESAALARLAHTHDVYVPTKIAWMLKTLAYSGEDEEARRLNQQAGRWWPEYKDMFFRNRMYGLLERGDFGAIKRLEEEVGARSAQSGYRDSVALVAALKSKSIAALREACADSDNFSLNLRCMIASGSLGDLDSAYAIADKLYPRRVGRTPAETEQIWLDDPEGQGPTPFITSPAAAPMRRDRRYLQLAERLGLLAYWRSGRTPDFCRKNPEPICAQLQKRR